MAYNNSQADIMAGDSLPTEEKNREELILSHLPLVKYIVGRLGYTYYQNIDYNDLVNQGIIGLIDAVDHYDPRHGTQLSTYATLKIRSKVLDYLRELDWMPRTTRERVKKVQDAINTLEKKLHRTPTDQEIGAFTGLDENLVQKALIDSSRIVVSLDLDDSFDTAEGEGLSLHEKLVDKNQVDPSEQYEEVEYQGFLVEQIKSLTEREQLILSLYYYEGLTFKEIGEVLEISESRVCQIHGKAIITLRARVS